jgi:hypothetical protein
MVTVARMVLSVTAAVALLGHPANRVPSGVREIDVRSPSGLVRVTEPAKIHRIVHWVDRLPTVRPGRFSCPMLIHGPTVTLVFRDAGGVLARARYAANSVGHSLVSGQCTPIRLTVRGRREKPLIGGRFLLRVQHLLGEKLLR